MGCWWVGLLGCAGGGGERGELGCGPKEREESSLSFFFNKNCFYFCFQTLFFVFEICLKFQTSLKFGNHL
jgi:hypothetical protein